MKNSMLILRCYIALILLIGATNTFAQTCFNTTLVGEARSGGFWDFAVAGDYAYVGSNSFIDIFRISDISMPVRVNSLSIFFSVQSLTISGRYLFVGGTSLQVFDLEDPINLKPLGVYTLSSVALKIRIYGTKAFICQQTRLTILDFSDPNNLQLLGSIGDANWYLTDIAVNDTLAFCPSQRLGVVIINISDLANPKQIGVFDTPGFANGVAIRDNVLYVTDGNLPTEERGLRVIDTSQPQNLAQIGFLPTAGDPWMVELSGNYAYISDRPGVRVVDITNPVAPVEVGQYVPQQFGAAIPSIAIGNKAIFLNTVYGISILDISNPTSIKETSVIGSFGPCSGYSVAVRGQFAYVADKAEGLRVINCEDLSYMFESKCFDTPGSATVVVIDSTFAYIADGNSGLRIIDITVPDDPKEIGFIDTPGAAANVTIQGHFAYVSDGATGLRIIDITNPANPNEVGFYDSPAKVTASAILGQIAYITDYTAGFRIIDISNLSAPVEVGVFDTPGVASDLTIADNYAYIADGGKGLRILDITDPKNIKEVGFFDTAGYAACIRKEGSYVYIADGNYGLRIIDVSEVTNPKEVGYYDSPGTVSGLDIVGSLIYLADGSTPLKIILNDLITNVTHKNIEKQEDFMLVQNYPNPFNPTTTIAFSVPQTEKVTLKVYNLMGKEIKTLVDRSMVQGRHLVQWDGTDKLGNKVTSGTYLYLLRIGHQQLSKKMVFLK